MTDEPSLEVWASESSAPEALADSADQAGSFSLLLVSTPIGNLGDMTVRGLAALRGCDALLCEDTRTTARLLSHYDVQVRTLALHDHNEEAQIASLLGRMRAGQKLALVSDAGTPLVSDPGFRLVRSALAEGLRISALPGPNAALMALTLSGLPPHPFMFNGFAPPRQAARLAAFAKLRTAEKSGLSATLIWYEAPHRLSETLADLQTSFGDRPAAVARELTKRFEEVRRGGLAELAMHYAAHRARGEICIVVGPAPEEPEPAADLDRLLTAALATQTVREAAAGVAEVTGLPRKQVYARALALKSAELG
jgi:16S rRNA (cytidine1402-2'-O)-methyltransferase